MADFSIKSVQPLDTDQYKQMEVCRPQVGIVLMFELSNQNHQQIS
jgi:hypothetical protein